MMMHEEQSAFESMLARSLPLSCAGPPPRPRTHFEDLPNDLWFCIMCYLPYTDLLQLRLVCKRWRDLVNRPYFMSRGKVIVTERNLHAMKQHVERGDSNIRFDCVELRNLRHSEELEQFLRLVGPEVGHLQVRHAPVFRTLDGTMPNLKILAIATTSFMDELLLQPVEGINLRQFVHLHSFECDGVSLDSSQKLLMLQQLRHVENKVRLRHLQFEYRTNSEAALLEVLSDHAGSLEYLDIFFSCSPDRLTGKWRVVFEKLQRVHTLKLSGNCHHDLLEAIVEALPAATPLRHLDLTGMLSLTNDLLMLIACKWKSTLRVLDLMFCVQLDGRCVQALQHLSGSLKVLTMAYCRELTGRGLLDGLALKPNYTLQELHLEEVCFIDEESICTLVERLPNLRRLGLDNCRHAVTNRTLAAIFQHQTKLQELNIDYCVRVTDAGLVGFGPKRYPISNLRGLRALNMRGCHNLTNRVLMDALRLPELRSLSVGYCNRFEAEGIAAFTINCPAVEKLCLASCHQVDDRAVESILQNLRRLRSLNVSNCPKITLHSVYQIARHGENLLEFTACGIDGLDSSAVKLILQRERPQLKQVLL
ncbi:F-box/LRR-repeat protein 7 [Scaptodrosophila lebanonensis]|uniref:F-box/LRR-repeat protein 7 n=1 Tax=Drosophila lebanonensis TaxID=7225 RepID=A0A6J2T1G0_DROLE|nr:F-box/LRR-repeat protein 7 [Scaptodrosophila lebanonensis]